MSLTLKKKYANMLENEGNDSWSAMKGIIEF